MKWLYYGELQLVACTLFVKKKENKLFYFLKLIYQEMECIYLPFGELELFACAFVVAKDAWEKNKLSELEEFLL